MGIDRTSHIPIYLQIKEELLQSILDGNLHTGEKILSEAKLAEKYRVNRLTARNAVTELVNDGYLSRVHGQGTFVSKRRVEDFQVGLTSFLQDMKLKGYTVRSEVIFAGCLEPGEEIADRLEIDPKEEVFRIKRRRFANEDVVVLQDAYILKRRCPDLLGYDFSTDSIYRVLTEEYGLSLSGARESIEACPADGETGELLDIEGCTPVLYSERKTWLAEGEPIEFCRSWYRSDRYIFNINFGNVKNKEIK